MKSLSVQKKDGSRKSLSGDVVEALRKRLNGELFTPDDGGYEASRTVWNGIIQSKPGMIAKCAGVDDVKTTVNFCRNHELLVSVRSGGHNVAGTAVRDGSFVIDVSNMRDVRVDPEGRLARVEGGARLGDVDKATQQFDLAAPIGVVSKTGVAGLTLHGGAGWLLRKHGLSIDNVAHFEIVTADGELLRVGEAHHPDLFWALRGGGGNFGVVTSFDFRLHPVGPKVWFSVPLYPLERSSEVMTFLRDYMAEAPEDLMAIGVYWSAPDVEQVPERFRGAPVVIPLACYTGPFESGEKVIAPLRNIGKPIADLSGPLKWVEAQTFLDEDYPDGVLYYWKSIYLNRLDDKVIETLSRHTAARPSPISSLDVWMLGGAAGRVSPTDTAFHQRTAPYLLGIEANWQNRSDTDANIEWARGVYDDMQRFADGGTYLNFPGFVEETDELLKGAYGPNLDRLRSVKAKYDPENLFPGTVNISPASART